MATKMLTEREVRTAAPPPGKTETTLYDGEGLTLRVRLGAGGVLKAWQFWFQRDGKRQRIGLGAYPEVSTAAAREKAEQYRTLLRAGITPTTAIAPAGEGRPLVPRTIEELAERWEADYLAAHHKDKGTAAMATLRRHALPALARVRLADVRKLHIVHVVQPLARDGRGRTAKVVLGLLRQMFTWAIRHDFAAADPTAGLRKADYGPAESARERVLSADEITELSKRLQASRRAGPAGRERDIPVLALPTQAAVWTMLATLARVGELCAARWESIDFERRLWSIPPENSKNGRPHLVHLSDFAVRHLRHLKQHAAGSPFVLPNSDGKGPLDPKTITKQLKDRQREAGRLKGRTSQADALALDGGPFTSHDLRRTGATMMRALGVDAAVVERCLNHQESDRLVATYQRAELLPERLDAFTRLGRRLDELVPAAATAHLEVGR